MRLRNVLGNNELCLNYLIELNTRKLYITASELRLDLMKKADRFMKKNVNIIAKKSF